MGLKAVFQTLGDMLFPPRCLFCDALIYPGWEICEACENDIAASPAIRRMKSGPSGDTVWCLTPFRYEGQVKESLMRFKFRGHGNTRPIMAEKLPKDFGSNGGRKLLRLQQRSLFRNDGCANAGTTRRS